MYKAMNRPAIIIDASAQGAEAFINAKANPETKKRFMEILNRSREDQRKLRESKSESYSGVSTAYTYCRLNTDNVVRYNSNSEVVEALSELSNSLKTYSLKTAEAKGANSIKCNMVKK